MSLLQTKHLSRSFKGLKAVDQVDLQINDREIHALIGPNGAGKTTLVSLLSGRLSADSGQILFDQNDITHLPAWRRVRRGIAYTFQITSIYAQSSVYDNIALAAHQNHQKIDEALQLTDLQSYAYEMAGSLSYGHQRLVEIAMGLALDPRLLILDEPTQGLSNGEIAQFANLITNLAQKKAILLIEHNMDLVMRIADHITVMDQGKILNSGSPDVIQKDKRVQAAYLGVSHV